MKKIAILCMLSACLVPAVWAQTPQALNYQAIARDAQGQPRANQPVQVIFSILEGSVNGPTVYAEVHPTIATNTFGLFTLSIGAGTPQIGAFGSINWASGPKFLKVDINNTLQGVTQLLSVPYALYAERTNMHAGSGITVNGNTIIAADTSATNELQTLSINGNQLSLNKGGGVVTLPTALPPSGAAGNDLSGFYPNPTVSRLQGKIISAIAPSAGQVLEWTGSAWTPTAPASSGVGWSLTGNIGTGSNNFIGTVDSQPISFRVNGMERMKLWGDGRLELFGKDTTNTFVGRRAGDMNLPGGTKNSFFGNEAGYSNTTGNSNTANGAGALYSNTIGEYNTANGKDALYSNTGGLGNSANGMDALYSNKTGSWNTANGYFALRSNTYGGGNVANGHRALEYNTTGTGNIAIGVDALYSNTTGDNNTALGGSSGPLTSFTNLINTTSLGFHTGVTASNTVRIGNGVISIGGPVAWTNLSDSRVKTNVQDNIPGLSFIGKLRPVTYRYDLHRQNEIMGVIDTTT